jgi:Fe-S oxidoreductase
VRRYVARPRNTAARRHGQSAVVTPASVRHRAQLTSSGRYPYRDFRRQEVVTLRPIPLLVISAIALPIVGRRAWRLISLVRSGSPSPNRFDHIPWRTGYALQKILGQKKLLQWSGPGLAHAFTFWGFLVIQVALVESFGEFFWKYFRLPIIGSYGWVGAVFDFFVLAVATALISFFIVRMKNLPKFWQRRSRFYDSHMGPAYLILLFIGGIVVTLLGINSSRAALGRLPYVSGAFLSRPIGHLMASHFSHGTLEAFDYGFLIAHIIVFWSFFVVVLHSKHLHIFTSLISVPVSRHPLALGRLRPLHIDIEQMDENTKIGVGAAEDLEWKHLLDGLTCTECGRCQSVCPAWNTGKELNPKLLVMNLRDHALAKMPVLIGETKPEEATGETKTACEQTLVPDVITEQVLWACVTCGACVYECPVDIEHVDMIMGMRRHQVMMESRFPREAQNMLQNTESSQNPWGISGDARLQWTKGQHEDVPVIGPGQQIPDDVEYLFWVGCAGASDDRAIRTTRAVASVLKRAGVKFAILGAQEACTGDPARRLGNEFLFQEIAKQNVETLNGAGARKIITQCPHCFNTLRKEYPDYGGNYDVVHHAELLSRLVAEGRLEPQVPLDAHVTYHDPCYLARHNNVLDDPRRVITATGARQTEMHRCGRKTFCCGAGGARFFMEETEGKRINTERIEEALGTNPDVVGTACPFCLVMLDDGVKDAQMKGGAEGVEVMDIATLLLRSMDGDARAPAAVGAPAATLEEAETDVPPDEGVQEQSED